MWPDHLDNPQAIYSAFPAGIPELKGLRAGRLLIDFAGGIFLGLEVQPLPVGSPLRWRETGNDGLEYRFGFYDVSGLSITGDVQFAGANFTLELAKGEARLFSPDPAFNAAFRFRGVKLYLRPYSGRRRDDFQDFWPPNSY